MTNPRWRTAAILEKIEKRHISATASPIAEIFGTVTQFDPLDHSHPEMYFHILKIQDGGGRHLEKSKIAIPQQRIRVNVGVRGIVMGYG